MVCCSAWLYFPDYEDQWVWGIQDLELARHEAERSKEEAEAANQEKSTLLANISHEICTQLNAILGYARLLRRQSGLGRKATAGSGLPAIGRPV